MRTRRRPRGERGHEHLRRRRLISQRGVWSDSSIVMPAPAFDHGLRLLERVEDLAIELPFPKIPSGLDSSSPTIWRHFRYSDPGWTGNPPLDKGAARSLLCAAGFPVHPHIFPAFAAREFCSQTIEFPPESRGALVILRQKSANFPVFSPGTGKQRAETGTPMTASSAIFILNSPKLKAPTHSAFDVRLGVQKRRPAVT